jgi:hypothetical protein
MQDVTISKFVGLVGCNPVSQGDRVILTMRASKATGLRLIGDINTKLASPLTTIDVPLHRNISDLGHYIANGSDIVTVAAETVHGRRYTEMPAKSFAESFNHARSWSEYCVWGYVTIKFKNARVVSYHSNNIVVWDSVEVVDINRRIPINVIEKSIELDTQLYIDVFA